MLISHLTLSSSLVAAYTFMYYYGSLYHTGIVLMRKCARSRRKLALRCESCLGKRKYVRRPEVRWLRKYANGDTY